MHGLAAGGCVRAAAPLAPHAPPPPLRCHNRGPLRVLAVRNRGRLRDPYDTPLRDGNRDRRGDPARAVASRDTSRSLRSE